MSGMTPKSLLYMKKGYPALWLVSLALCGACALFQAHDVSGNKGGALDRILLSEKTYEAGPFYFDHRLHYASGDEGGAAIPCRVCHHTYRGSPLEPPRSCSLCHLPHSALEENHLPSL
jgi:hypothetical protein